MNDSSPKTALIVFGTRPEAIKMAPIVRALSNTSGLSAITCATAQHRELMDQVVDFFGIPTHYDLDLMRPGQDLFSLTGRCLMKMRQVLIDCRPDLVLVQGDTSTAFAAALAAFYLKIPIAHVEAGLRTSERYSPFPEELNRRMITPLSDLHFAPTRESAENLLRENIPSQSIFETGNTSIDALLWAAAHQRAYPELKSLWGDRTMILMTAHRRENFGEPLVDIFDAVRKFAQNHPEVQIVFPVHPNPNVALVAKARLGGVPNISLLSPVTYPELVFLLSECQFVLTDSGGLQEEAPAIGKPVLVLRESTERPEAVSANCARLVGHDRNRILESMNQLLDREGADYQLMSRRGSPYGDGRAAIRIAGILEKYFEGRESKPRPAMKPRPKIEYGPPRIIHSTVEAAATMT